MTARDPDELIRLGQLIDVALDVPPEERGVLLARACGSDKELFDTVWAILVDLDRASGFLQTPAVLSLYPLQEEVPTEDPDGRADLDPSATSASEALKHYPNRPPELRTQHTDTGFVRRHAPGLTIIALAGILGVISLSWNRMRDMRSQKAASTLESETILRSRRERARTPDASSGTGEGQRPEVRAALREKELGRKLIQHGAYDSAELRLREAMTLFTIAGDEASLEAADARRLLANALGSTGHRVEAERELRAALHVYRLFLDADDPRVVEVLSSLADLLAKSGRQAEADSMRNSAVRGHRSDAMKPPST